MKKLCIYTFSGTGMTSYVVKRTIAELEKHNVHVDHYFIGENADPRLPFNTYDMIGIAYPVHAFNAPLIVTKFVKQMPKVNSKSTFVICTAAEDSKLNSASSHSLIRTLRRKGYAVFYDRLVAMPSNFVIKYSEEKVTDLLNDANQQINDISHDVLHQVIRSRESNLFLKLLSFIGKAEWFGAKCASKFFYTTDNCNKCGACKNKCPHQNIELINGKLIFKWRCGLCMKCLYICPQRAIKIRLPFKFIGFDNWYSNPDIALQNRNKQV